MLCTLLAVFSVSVTRTHLAPVRLAGIVATHRALQSSHVAMSKRPCGFSPRHAWGIRVPHGQGNTRARQRGGRRGSVVL
jgi:hypothetical protein